VKIVHLLLSGGSDFCVAVFTTAVLPGKGHAAVAAFSEVTGNFIFRFIEVNNHQKKRKDSAQKPPEQGILPPGERQSETDCGRKSKKQK
jgi:hypothetical protein